MPTLNLIFSNKTHVTYNLSKAESTLHSNLLWLLDGSCQNQKMVLHKICGMGFWLQSSLKGCNKRSRYSECSQFVTRSRASQCHFTIIWKVLIQDQDSMLCMILKSNLLFLEDFKQSCLCNGSLLSDWSCRTWNYDVPNHLLPGSSLFLGFDTQVVFVDCHFERLMAVLEFACSRSCSSVNTKL